MFDEIEEKKTWHWHLGLYFSASPEMIVNLKERLARIQALVGGSTNKINQQIWLIGLKTLEEDHGLLINPNGENQTIAMMYHQMIVEDIEIAKLRKLYIRRFLNRPDDFKAFCRANDVSDEVYEKIIEGYTPPPPTRREKAKAWCLDLLADGRSYPTKDIREAAIKEGIIDNSDRDWAWLRQLASDEGWTGNADYGEWALPDNC